MDGLGGGEGSRNISRTCSGLIFTIEMSVCMFPLKVHKQAGKLASK